PPSSSFARKRARSNPPRSSATCRRACSTASCSPPRRCPITCSAGSNRRSTMCSTRSRFMPDAADDAQRARELLAQAKRVVIKVGSRALSAEREIYDRLAAGVAEAHEAKKSVAMVSSGAIALGMQKLRLPARPKEMALLQASAAAGQSVLMRLYEEAFGRRDL